MTQSAQQKGGGANTYRRFWRGIDSIDVLDTSVQGDQVVATLRFVTKRDRKSTEEYALTLVEQDDQLLIDTFENRGRVADPGNGDSDGDEDDGDN